MERKKRKQSVEETVDNVKRIIKAPKIVKSQKLISTGCSMLDLALSGIIGKGYALGTVIHLIGDTHTGKSLLALSMMAEASIDKRLDKYDLVYEEPESAMFFPVESMFGKKAKDRIIFHPPKEKRKEPRTVQMWHNDLMKWDLPFVWVTDSFDALTSEEDLSEKTADGKKKKLGKGGFRIEKPIVAKQLFPKAVGRMEASGSLFMWISQTIDNIGTTFGPNKTFQGGNAIRFFRAYEIWLAVVTSITKRVRKKEREIGAWVRAKVKKNKFTGKIREVDFPVYYEFGVDDIGAMVNWMVSEGFWVKVKKEDERESKKPLNLNQKIETEDPFIDGKFIDVVKHIENNDLEGKLKEVVQECWDELEGEISIKRKKRY